MGVAGCAKCERFISLSIIPGGNPVALADPEKWAVKHAQCTECGSYLCDRCAEGFSFCPECHGSLKFVGYAEKA